MCLAEDRLEGGRATDVVVVKSSAVWREDARNRLYLIADTNGSWQKVAGVVNHAQHQESSTFFQEVVLSPGVGTVVKKKQCKVSTFRNRPLKREKTRP